MLGEREFTTEEVARYCGVSRPAVVSWIAQSLLPARSTQGGHRRVLRPDLARFLQQQGYEVPPEVTRVRPLMFVVGGESLDAEALAGVFAQDFEVRTWQPSVELLLGLGAQRPDVLVAAVPMPALDGARLMRAVARSPATEGMLRVAVVTHDDEAAGARRAGADLACVAGRPDELYAAVVRRVSELQRRQVV